MNNNSNNNQERTNLGRLVT